MTRRQAPEQDPTRDADRTFSTHEAARLLGKSPQTVRDWFDAGRLHGFRASDGTRRIPAGELRRHGARVPEGPVPRRDVGRHAAHLAEAVAADLEQALVDVSVDEVRAALVSAVRQEVAARDAQLARLADLQVALWRLATAPWWRRRRVVRELRRNGALAEA